MSRDDRIYTRSDGSPEGELLEVGLEPPLPHAWIRRALALGYFGYCPNVDAVKITSPDIAEEEP